MALNAMSFGARMSVSRMISRGMPRYYTSMHDIYSGKRKQEEIARLKQEERQRAIESGGEQATDYTTTRDRDEVAERSSLVYDEHTGVRPTERQRFWMVVTQMYPSKKSIPEYVSVYTLSRLGNRIRIVFITTLVFAIGSLSVWLETMLHKKILRDRVKLADSRPIE